MKFLKGMGLLACVLLISSSVWARTETRCYFGRCLSEGWETTEWGSNSRWDTRCNNRDCTRFGWVSRSNYYGYGVEAVCKPGGCFREGWSERRYAPNAPIQYWDVACYNGDCLYYGWVSRSHWGASTDTQCDRNYGACVQSGWTTYVGGGRSFRSMCTFSRCFEYGWTTDAW